MLTRRASKFCVKPRSPFSEIFDHDPKTIGKPLIIVSWPECRPGFPRDDDGGGGGDDGGFPRTLESGRSPGPTCPGTKYPVRESLTSISARMHSYGPSVSTWPMCHGEPVPAQRSHKFGETQDTLYGNLYIFPGITFYGRSECVV